MVPWKNREKLTPRFRSLIENAAHDSQVYLPVTSDWRDASFVDPGASKTSRHLHGEGVDFDIPLKGHGTLVGPLVVALIRRATAMGIVHELEIELVASKRDSHLHLALDPKQKVIAIFGATD